LIKKKPSNTVPQSSNGSSVRTTTSLDTGNHPAAGEC
jgi:hypothetical protein